MCLKDTFIATKYGVKILESGAQTDVSDVRVAFSGLVKTTKLFCKNSVAQPLVCLCVCVCVKNYFMTVTAIMCVFFCCCEN